MFFTVLGWICLFFAGLLLGVLFVVLTKVRETRSKIAKIISKKKSNYSYNKEKINIIVKQQRKIYKKKNRFHVLKKVAGFTPKTKGYFAMYGEIINEVAKLQNPQSNMPFLEFSVNQAFDFINDVTLDLEDVISSLDMPVLKTMEVSTIYGFVDLKNRINQIKAIKVNHLIGFKNLKILFIPIS